MGKGAVALAPTNMGMTDASPPLPAVTNANPSQAG